MIYFLALAVLTCATDDRPGLSAREDFAPVGAEWEGTYKAVETSSSGKRKNVTMDIRIVVMDRKGEKFTGEYWGDNNKKGFAIEGTVDSRSVMNFKFTKKLKGSWPADMIDNAQVRVVINKTSMTGKYTKTGNERVVADLVLKLKKPA